MALSRRYVCSFCKRGFTRKSWYDKHICEPKRRFLDLNNIHTIKAHRLFCHWQRRSGLMRKGKEKTREEFLRSPLYKAFKDLAVFTHENYVVSAYKYVDWLVEHKIPQREWCSQEGIEVYHDYRRVHEDPMSQIETTLKNIRVWCEHNEVPLNEFVDRVPPSKALSMVQSNQLCPWFLFGYMPALDRLVDRFENETLYALDEHINIAYWLNKVKTEESVVELINQQCDEIINVPA